MLKPQKSLYVIWKILTKMNVMGLIKGSVTPFGLLNDREKHVVIFLNEYFRDRTISAHPNENIATVFLQANDLMKLLEMNGDPVSCIQMDD